MRTTHLLWTGTVAVHPRQEVLTAPRQKTPPPGDEQGDGAQEGAGRSDPPRLPAGLRRPDHGLSGAVTTLAVMLIGAHAREDDPVVSAAERGADIVQIFLADPQGW